MKFNKGDVIRCIRPDFGLTKDKVYVVLGSYGNSSIIVDDSDHKTAWLHDRFELAGMDVDNAPGIVVEMTLPTDSNERKNYPLFRGVLNYFPAALAGVAKISKLGNDKHNPGQELHHARGKSVDHSDCIIRHLMDTADLLAALDRHDRKVTPEQVLNEVNQMAWRALAFSQELQEKFGAPLAPGAKK